MVIEFSLSQRTVQGLQSIDPNLSQSIEFLVRYFQGCGFPTPFYPRDKGLRVVCVVNISPYALNIPKRFGIYGLNPSKSIDWLVIMYHSNSYHIQEAKEPKKTPYPERKRVVHVSVRKEQIIPRR